MNKMLLIAVGLMLSVIAGCTALKEDAGKALSFAESIQTLKTDGCDALPETSKRLLVLLIKSRIPEYPLNGICDQDWVRDVLLKQIDKLESTDVYNEPTSLGHSTNSWNGQLDKPSRVQLLLGTAAANDNGTVGLYNRSGINTKASSFVYASSIEAHKGGRSNTRLHLYEPLQSVHKERSGLDIARSDGSCRQPSVSMETQCSLYSGSNWRKG
jgi:hypothetical protein